jgi:dienelactone hydrolase
MLKLCSDWVRSVRFARGWVGSRWDVDESEIELGRDGTIVPGTLFLPAGRRAGLPGWVVLHGITRPGRLHPSLLRFARSVAATGAAVLVPDIPEWRALRLSPATVVPTIRASILALDARPETVPGRTGLVGFSFGAPTGIAAAADPSMAGHLAGVVGFGGYCDLERTMRFQFTGRHEWAGREERLVPDPYGRWVVGANYLTGIPGHEDADDVADALRHLAAEAGDRRIESTSPVYDPVKSSLRREIAPERRPLFDLFAPHSGRQPDEGQGERLAVELARAARRAAPALDPRPVLDRVPVPVRLVHGREDRLIPYTETLRLARRFPKGADVSAFVTGLFAHSQPHSAGARFRFAWEGVRFLDGLRRALGVA